MRRAARRSLGLGAALHARRERGVHQPLDRRHGAEARAELDRGGPARDEELLHFLVDGEIGAPKAVDGLLRIPDDEELAGDGGDGAVIGDRGVVGGEEQEQLGLERIGVLELVDEDALEALLERGAHRGDAPDHVARLHQEIDEVEAPRPLLEQLVAPGGAGELALEQRREIGVGGHGERGERLEELAQLALELGADDALAVHLAGALAVAGEIAIARQRAELRLDLVVVAAPPACASDPAGEIARRRGVQEEGVVRLLRVRAAIGEAVQAREDGVDRGHPIEGPAAPGRREITPLA